MDLYIGINSGTSLDAVDAVLCEFHQTSGTTSYSAPHPQSSPSGTISSINIIASVSVPLDASLREDLVRLIASECAELASLGALEVRLAIAYAAAVQELLFKWMNEQKKRLPEAHECHDLCSERVRAIGAHGQTVFHSPDSAFPFSLQLLDGNKLAALTGLDVVCDFRRMDIACGGQGAPLTPLFHRALFTCTSAEHELRFVLNLGGIANITVLEPASHSGNGSDDKRLLLGFDTGPANCLLDLWTQRHFERQFDRDGKLASKGRVIEPLLYLMLKEPYFQRSFPKSTGKELFNMHWVDEHIEEYKGVNPNHSDLDPLDVLRTLLELTAQTVASGITQAFEGQKYGGKLSTAHTYTLHTSTK